MLARNSFVKFDPRRVPGCDMWFRRGTGLIYTASYVTGWLSEVGGYSVSGSGGIVFNAADAQYGNKPSLSGSDTVGFGYISRPDPQQPFTVVFVGHVGNTRAVNVIYRGRYDGSPNTWLCVFANSDASMRASIGSFNADTYAWTVAGTSSAPATSPSVIVAVFNGANSSIRSNSNTPSSGSLSSVQTNNSTVGMTQASWGCCMRTTVHFATWNRALSDLEQRYLMAGFARESGLVVT
jgi:hypothetical protein